MKVTNAEEQWSRGNQERRRASEKPPSTQARSFAEIPMTPLIPNAEQTEEQREDRSEKLNKISTAKVAGSEDDDGKPLHVSKPGMPAPAKGIIKPSSLSSDAKDPNSQVEPSQRAEKSRRAPRHRTPKDEEEADQEKTKQKRQTR